MSTYNDDTHKDTHKEWEGENKIIIGIDIGATQSGVAYTFLQRGVEQSVHRVLSWPGQEDQNSCGKTPTLVWYNTESKAVSFGAEALSAQTEEIAEEQQWQLAKYFKLHLHPQALRARHDLTIDPLPSNVTIGQIYADFLGYLLQHTQNYFQERTLDGERVWQTYSPTMEVVVAHPNGWGIREQSFLRKAAVAAGLTTQEQAVQKVHFVTEAEASVHFCMHWTNLKGCLVNGVKFAVCDAGGSTVDTAIYTVRNTEPCLQLEEGRAPSCIQAGGIFVDRHAKEYLQQALSRAEISSEEKDEYVKRGVDNFEQGTKRAFRGIIADGRIQIAGARFNKPDAGIRRGCILLNGAIIGSFFDPCVEQIIRSHQSSADIPISYLILVGGFGESPYLRERLKAAFSVSGSQVVCVNEATSKAVADGAVMWRYRTRTIGRAPRYSFGVETITALVPNSHEQAGYPIITRPSGNFVNGIWSQLVSKGVVIDQGMVVRQPYCYEYESFDSEMPDMSECLYSYDSGEQPLWIRSRTGALANGFTEVCSMTVRLNDLRGALQPTIAPNGKLYWALRLCLCLKFGSPELKASLEWVENGTKRTGPVQIIPVGVD